MAPMPQDPMMQPEGQEAPGKTICITANADGSFTVELEPAETAPEAPEMGTENGMQDMAEDKTEGETGQTVASLDEALALAKQMLGGGEDRMSVEQAFSEGFNGQPQGKY